MSENTTTREELSAFVGRCEGYPRRGWHVLEIYRFGAQPFFLDVHMGLSSEYGHFRIHAIEVADYAIRPMNPGLLEGGPVIKHSTDDPRLADRLLQYIPHSDGELYDPPRRFQLLELDQTWIIAVRFEIETQQLLRPFRRNSSSNNDS